MSKFVLLASASALICVTAFGFFGEGKDTPRAVNQTQAIVTATTAFLNSLSADQRQKVQFPFTPQKRATAAKFARTGGPGGPGMGAAGGFIGEQYGQAVWSNFPVTDVPRPGLRLGSLTTAQRNGAMHLLQIALKP